MSTAAIEAAETVLTGDWIAESVEMTDEEFEEACMGGGGSWNKDYGGSC
ncbi:hypothetical protein ACWCPF_42380 [Streptomyces sp. NPDC001858]